MKKHNYQVIVGNIGTVYEGTNGFEAIKEYNQYVSISKEGTGRAGNEQVTLLRDNDIYKEYLPPIMLKVLSIDAWSGDEPKTWDWNNWFNVGQISLSEFEALKTDKEIAVWFFDNGYTTNSDMRKIVIEDDQYNLVITDRKTNCPLFAIEYGPAY